MLSAFSDVASFPNLAAGINDSYDDTYSHGAPHFLMHFVSVLFVICLSQMAETNVIQNYKIYCKKHSQYKFIKQLNKDTKSRDQTSATKSNTKQQGHISAMCYPSS